MDRPYCQRLAAIHPPFICTLALAIVLLCNCRPKENSVPDISVVQNQPVEAPPAPEDTRTYSEDELLDDVTDRNEFRHVITNAKTVGKIGGLRIPDEVRSSMGDSLSMGAAIYLLPELLRKNVSLKHGIMKPGLRGHQAEYRFSQSSDTVYPRVLLWDEENGFSLGWNGGLPWQKAGQRIDVFDYDHKNQAFILHALKFPITSNGSATGFPYKPMSDHELVGAGACSDCHGKNLRPVLNMYPDWLGFYGSDNDEISTSGVDAAISAAGNRGTRSRLRTKKAYVAEEERFFKLFKRGLNVDSDSQLRSFKADVAKAYGGEMPDRVAKLNGIDLASHRKAMNRYLPLTRVLKGPYYDVFRRVFASDPRMLSQVDANFPFRPTNDGNIEHQSRAFFFRPNLRVGILYNRLNAKYVFYNYLKPSFRGSKDNAILRETFLMSALDCRWEDDRNAYDGVRDKFGFSLFRSPTGRHRIHFMELMRKFKHRRTGEPLRLADYDIRFMYKNPEYKEFDPDQLPTYSGRSGEARPAHLTKFTNSVTGLGYFVVGSDKNVHERYGNANNRRFYRDGDYYFNSYWDGSASINEYIAAMIIADNDLHKLARHDRGALRTFVHKYGMRFDRFSLDKKYYFAMDTIFSENMEHKQLFGWVPAPYPNDIGHEHHRESFSRRESSHYPFYLDNAAGVNHSLRRSSRRVSHLRDSPGMHEKICKKALTHINNLLR